LLAAAVTPGPKPLARTPFAPTSSSLGRRAVRPFVKSGMTCGLHHQKCSRISVLNSLQYFSRWRRLFVSDLVTRDMIGPNPHSREGSGEHRPVDINALVEESLNLAWHGARAEKQGFEVTLKQSFDSSAGEVDVFPQDITRVFSQSDFKRLLCDERAWCGNNRQRL